MMKSSVLALSLLIAVPVASAPQTQDRGTQYRWMGEMTCGGWRRTPRDLEMIQKAALLNWVLGFISGRTALRGEDLLDDVDQASVSAWLDDYCAQRPLDNLLQAAVQLETDLQVR